MNILYFLIPVLFIVGTSFIAVKAVKKGANKKHAVIAQIASVACAMVVCTAMPAITNVSAETSDKATVSTSESASNDGASCYGTFRYRRRNSGCVSSSCSYSSYFRRP